MVKFNGGIIVHNLPEHDGIVIKLLSCLLRADYTGIVANGGAERAVDASEK